MRRTISIFFVIFFASSPENKNILFFVMNSKKSYCCKVCGTEDEGDFYQSRKNLCKKHLLEDRKKRYPEIKDRMLDNGRRWRADNPFRHRLLGAKHRARRQKIPCTITEKTLRELWEEQDGFCYYSGIAMEEAGSGPYSLSIDQVDPAKGYTADNVVLCLSVVNTMKWNNPTDEFLKLCQAVAAHMTQ
jgi:hypothetical protein